MEDYVKVHVRLKQGEDMPAGETPWATPVQATSAGGTYALANDLIFTPLRHGDVVRCALDGNSIYQVVEVGSLVEGNLFTFQHPVKFEGDVVPVLEDLIAHGLEVNRPTDGWVQVLVPESELDPFAEPAGYRLPPEWELFDKLSRDEREACIAQDVDCELDTSTLSPEGPIDYWVPGDPAWGQLGVTDTNLLARVQSLAASDPRVLATIEAGRHEDVLTFIGRLSVADPRYLPKLDRPLLVNPDE